MPPSSLRTQGLVPAAMLIIIALLLESANAATASGCTSQNTGGENPISNLYMSNGLCTTHCGGYAFGIVQGQTCSCSNLAPAEMGDTSQCNQKCPGYPSELCGGSGVYGYIQLGEPHGTAPSASSPSGSSSSGSDSGGSDGDSNHYVPPPPPPSPPPPQTVVQTNVQYQVSTQVQLQTSVVVSAQPVVTPSPVTVTETPDSSSTLISVYTSTAERLTETVKPSYITESQRVTVSGAVVTRLVTSTAALPSSPPQENELPHQTSSGPSKGDVAGITIASIAGAVIIGLLIWFFCYRRRKRSEQNNGASVSRNPSVLSKVGLLARTESNVREPPPATLPRIRTSGIGIGGGPDSAGTLGSSFMSEHQQRRTSRPIFVDNRLNPNALMVHSDLSRTSIGTLQDNQDYSRPLEIRNPDA